MHSKHPNKLNNLSQSTKTNKSWNGILNYLIKEGSLQLLQFVAFDFGMDALIPNLCHGTPFTMQEGTETQQYCGMNRANSVHTTVCILQGTETQPPTLWDEQGKLSARHSVHITRPKQIKQ